MELNQEQSALISRLTEKKQMYYRLAFSLVSNEEDALDAISQMTVRIVENIHALRSPEAFDAWSKRILINVCKEFWRTNPKTMPIDEALTKESVSGLDIEDELIIKQFISRLPEIHWEVIHLRFYLDYEYKEIARILEIPEGTVKSRLNRALETLREQMGGALYG